MALEIGENMIIFKFSIGEHRFKISCFGKEKNDVEIDKNGNAVRKEGTATKIDKNENAV